MRKVLVVKRAHMPCAELWIAFILLLSLSPLPLLLNRSPVQFRHQGAMLDVCVCVCVCTERERDGNWCNCQLSGSFGRGQLKESRPSSPLMLFLLLPLPIVVFLLFYFSSILSIYLLGFLFSFCLLSFFLFQR